MEEKSEGKKLHQLFEEEWEYFLKDKPEDASMYHGDKRYTRYLQDKSFESFKER